MKTPVLSIISPVYKAESMIPELVRRIEAAVSPITDDFEIILVEDCGPDQSWSVIEQLAKTNPCIKGIKLSRNFGQHYAITCGLDHCYGEWVVVMDCDLQDVPEEIPNLMRKAQEGFDIVLARRVERNDHWWTRFTSKIFYTTLSYLTGTTQDHTVANFGIYHHEVIESIRLMRESIRYFPTMVTWVGFNKTFLDVQHGPREEGSSGYTFRKRLKLALDIMLAYSNKPLLLTVQLGLILASTSFLVSLVVLIFALIGKYTVSGYASIMMSLWFLAGLIIFILGVVGLYLAKVFEGVKNRPLYFVSKHVNI